MIAVAWLSFDWSESCANPQVRVCAIKLIPQAGIVVLCKCQRTQRAREWVSRTHATRRTCALGGRWATAADTCTDRPLPWPSNGLTGHLLEWCPSSSPYLDIIYMGTLFLSGSAELHEFHLSRGKNVRAQWTRILIIIVPGRGIMYSPFICTGSSARNRQILISDKDWPGWVLFNQEAQLAQRRLIFQKQTHW